jgi:hypothetical protein
VWDDATCIIAAATSGKDEGTTTAMHGLVQGHAYSVLQVKEAPGGFQMLQLRNPWGTFEWDGAWSDKSELWSQHPKVRNFTKSQLLYGCMPTAYTCKVHGISECVGRAGQVGMRGGGQGRRDLLDGIFG